MPSRLLACAELACLALQSGLILCWPAACYTPFHNALLLHPTAPACCSFSLPPLLFLAFHPRDLDHYFVDLLEEATEMHAPSYSRQQAQQAPAAWARALKAGGRFRVVHYSAHPNRMVLEGSEALAEVMAATSYSQGTLAGEAWAGWTPAVLEVE